MTACFGSAAHAPLAMILMVAEMTGTLELVLPAMIAIGLATVVVGDRSIYEHQVEDRAASPGHRFRNALPLLATVPVTAAMRTSPLTIDDRTGADEARGLLAQEGLAEAPVIDEHGTFLGIVRVGALEHADGKRSGDVVDNTAPSVPMDATLEDAVEGLATSGATQVPVLDDRRSILGVITATQAVEGYQTALRSNLSRFEGWTPGTVLVEATVTEGARAAGSTIDAARFPAGSVVMAIIRGHALLIPEGRESMEVGDHLMMLAPTGEVHAVRVAITGAPDQASDP